MQELSGSTAFVLHDTYGFPLELTQEIASERGVTIDIAGFESEMAEQRTRAKAARGRHREGANVDAYRRIVEEHGTTTFLGYVADNGDRPGARRRWRSSRATRTTTRSTVDGELVEIFLDQTPFYAESGGQVGDTGTISTETGTAEVIDTTFALPNLRRHTARIVTGTITAGQAAAASIDAERRGRDPPQPHGHPPAPPRPAHGARRAREAGRLAGRARSAAVRLLALRAGHRRADRARSRRWSTPRRSPTRRWTIFETSKDEAEELGAIAFFGDKYGDVVRVLEAGPSIELCGGTHVSATGDIGTVKVVSEGSIGSNLRRIEAVTGTGVGGAAAARRARSSTRSPSSSARPATRRAACSASSTRSAR